MPARLRCSSPGNCFLVGTVSGNSGDSSPGLAIETARIWAPAVAVTTLVAAGVATTNSSLACVSPGNCAIGGFDSSGDLVLVSDTNGVWAPPAIISSIPGLDASSPDTPFDVAPTMTCASPGNCVAAGVYSEALDSQGNTQGVGYVVSETDGVWGTVDEIDNLVALNSVHNTEPTIDALTCVSAGICMLGGMYNTTFSQAHYNEESFVVSETNGVWGDAVEVPGTASLNVSGLGQVNAIVCFASEHCQIGGTYLNAKHQARSYVATEKGGAVWTTVAVGSKTGDDFVLTQLSCGSLGNCVAVSGSQTGSNTQVAQFAQLAVEAKGHWSSPSYANVTIRKKQYLSDAVDNVSCVAGGYCAVVGFYVVKGTIGGANPTIRCSLSSPT